MCWVTFAAGIFVGANIGVMTFAIARIGGRDLKDG
jgi:hypothetical protein